MKYTGVKIYKEIWEIEDLLPIEKVLLTLIKDLDDVSNGKGCFASNEYFQEYLGRGNVSVVKYLKNLEQHKDELIKRKTYFDDVFGIARRAIYYKGPEVEEQTIEDGLIWIPDYIWKLDDLDVVDKTILTEITQLVQNNTNGTCLATNLHFMQKYNLSDNKVKHIINRKLKSYIITKGRRPRKIMLNKCFKHTSNAKNNEYESVNSEYESVNNEYESVNSEYESVNNEYESVNNEYESVNNVAYNSTSNSSINSTNNNSLYNKKELQEKPKVINLQPTPQRKPGYRELKEELASFNNNKERLRAAKIKLELAKINHHDWQNLSYRDLAYYYAYEIFPKKNEGQAFNRVNSHYVAEFKASFEGLGVTNKQRIYYMLLEIDRKYKMVADIRNYPTMTSTVFSQQWLMDKMFKKDLEREKGQVSSIPHKAPERKPVATSKAKTEVPRFQNGQEYLGFPVPQTKEEMEQYKESSFKQIKLLRESGYDVAADFITKGLIYNGIIKQ